MYDQNSLSGREQIEDISAVPREKASARAVRSVVPEVEGSAQKEGEGEGDGGGPLTRQPCLGLGRKNQPLRQ